MIADSTFVPWLHGLCPLPSSDSHDRASAPCHVISIEKTSRPSNAVVYVTSPELLTPASTMFKKPRKRSSGTNSGMMLSLITVQDVRISRHIEGVFNICVFGVSTVFSHLGRNAPSTQLRVPRSRRMDLIKRSRPGTTV
jgi:hypothetical protein